MKFPKKSIYFQIFDERHTAHNIYRIIKIILEEYDLINKTFAISFNNASANTTSTPELEKICKPTFGVNFSSKICLSYFKFMCARWFKTIRGLH